MNIKYTCKKFLVLLLMLPAVSFAATWSPYDDITANNFYYTTGSNITAITMSTNFATTCSNQDTGNLKSSEVGDEMYKIVNSVLITALASNRQISLYHDGCTGSRAKIIGIRLGN